MPQLPTSILTDKNPSAFHREFENNYMKMPQLSMPLPTDNSLLAFHRKFKNNYLKMPQLPTPIPTDNSPSAFHREFKNNYLKMPQLPTPLRRIIVYRHFTESSKIITWNATITDDGTDGINSVRKLLTGNITDKITDELCKFQGAVH